MDDVTKYGPVDGIRLRQRKKFHSTRNVIQSDLKPGEERVKQKGEPGTKTITTPTTKNPLTGKSWRGEPTEKITKQQ